jgi:hypothetical protein
LFNTKFEEYYKLDIDWERANDEDLTIRDEVLANLNKYKDLFMEEWKISKNLPLDKVNFKRLKELNDYINSNL